MEPVSWLIYFLVVMAISYGVAYLTRKDPQDIKYDPDTFTIPEIKEGTKFTIVAGTCWQEAPVIAWFGDIYTQSLGIRLSDTGGQYIYLNLYHYGALHILTQGYCDGVIQIKVGDLVVWPSNIDVKELNDDAAASAIINLPELYGGIHEYHASVTGRGGITGTVDFQYGLPAQTLNDYLASQLGTYVSANRGLTTAILRRPYIGLSSTLYLWKYLIKRTDYLASGEAQWYPAKSAIRTYEINPIHWLREIYTDTEWGLGMPTAKLNDTNLKAAADILYDEGFGICIKWEGEQSLENHVIDVLRYINGVIYEDHATGLIEIKLIRDDYITIDSSGNPEESLEEFDETDIVSVEGFTRGVMHKIPDVTYVKYWNMYANLPVTVASHDMSLIDSQNETLIPNDVDYTAVINDKLAGRLAARDQQQLSSFAATLSIKCKRTMSHLKPGDVFKLSYPPLGIVSIYVRVVTPHYGTLTDGIVTFDCMEDTFGMKNSLYAPPPATSWDSEWQDPDGITSDIAGNEPLPTTSFLMETPFWDLVKIYGHSLTLLLDEASGYLMVGALHPEYDSYAYELLIRNSLTLPFISQARLDYTPSALITEVMPLDAEDMVLSLDESLSNIPAGSYAVIDEEIVKVTVDIDTGLVETVNVARGCLDTVPALHAIGARMWFIGTVRYIDSDELTEGTQPGVKILTETKEGLLDEGSAPIDNADAFDTRQNRPYPPGKFLINGESYPSTFSSDVDSGETPGVTISWTHRDRTQQLDYIVEHSEASIGPEAGVTYTLKIYDEDNILCHTEIGLTGTSFLYTEAQEVIDCGELQTELRFVLYSVRDDN